MIRQMDDFARDVRVSLDQNMSSEQLAAVDDIDTLSLEEIIRSKIPEAVRRVHTDAPAYLLEGMRSFGDAIYWKEMESGYVLLPGRFMRLVVFEMSDWEQPVYSAISADDEEYERQRSRIKGIRGTAQKPVCAITVRPEGRALEFYSCKSERATVKRALYMPYPRVDDNDGIEVSRRCYEQAVLEAASLVALTLGDAEKSEALIGNIKY